MEKMLSDFAVGEGGHSGLVVVCRTLNQEAVGSKPLPCSSELSMAKALNPQPLSIDSS